MVEANKEKMDLVMFLEQDNVIGRTYEVEISDRLKEFKFVIKPMSFEEYSQYQQKASSIKKKSMDFDTRMFYMDMIIEHTIYPNFKDSETLKRLGFYSAEEFVNNKLFPNEIMTLANAIAEVSGFNKDFDAIITEAKN